MTGELKTPTAVGRRAAGRIAADAARLLLAHLDVFVAAATLLVAGSTAMYVGLRPADQERGVDWLFACAAWVAVAALIASIAVWYVSAPARPSGALSAIVRITWDAARLFELALLSAAATAIATPIAGLVCIPVVYGVLYAVRDARVLGVFALSIALYVAVALAVAAPCAPFCLAYAVALGQPSSSLDAVGRSARLTKGRRPAFLPLGLVAAATPFAGVAVLAPSTVEGSLLVSSLVALGLAVFGATTAAAWSLLARRERAERRRRRLPASGPGGADSDAGRTGCGGSPADAAAP